MIDIDPNDFLMGSGAKSATFTQVGDTVIGYIVRKPETMIQTDYVTKEPKKWKDGSPQLQLRVLLLTEEHEDNDDNGERAIYIRGAMAAAIRDAVKAAGGAGLEVGGKLAVRFSGLAEPKGNLNPAKLFEAKYKLPPAGTAAANGAPSVHLQDPEPAEDFSKIPF